MISVKVRFQNWRPIRGTNTINCYCTSSDDGNYYNIDTWYTDNEAGCYIPNTLNSHCPHTPFVLSKTISVKVQFQNWTPISGTNTINCYCTTSADGNFYNTDTWYTDIEAGCYIAITPNTHTHAHAPNHPCLKRPPPPPQKKKKKKVKEKNEKKIYLSQWHVAQQLLIDNVQVMWCMTTGKASLCCCIWSWSPVPCEKHGPKALSRQKPRPKAEVFVVTEARGPCFSHGMGDHDQILL